MNNACPQYRGIDIEAIVNPRRLHPCEFLIFGALKKPEASGPHCYYVRLLENQQQYLITRGLREVEEEQ